MPCPKILGHIHLEDWRLNSILLTEKQPLYYMNYSHPKIAASSKNRDL